MRSVPPADWATELAACRAEGFDLLDMIAGVDRLGCIEVVASLMRPVDASTAILSTRLPDDRALESVCHLYPGASWYERELAEMFGVQVTGGSDSRPLLRRTDAGAPTLLKSTVLGARVLTPWPGDAGADGDAKANRRRQRAVGVTEGWYLDADDRGTGDSDD